MAGTKARGDRPTSEWITTINGIGSKKGTKVYPAKGSTDCGVRDPSHAIWPL